MTQDSHIFINGILEDYKHERQEKKAPLVTTLLDVIKNMEVDTQRNKTNKLIDTDNGVVGTRGGAERLKRVKQVKHMLTEAD